MSILLLYGLGSAGIAHATDLPFRIGTDAGVFWVSRWVRPPATVRPLHERVCRVALRWRDDALAVEPRDCLPAVAAESEAALRKWQITPPPASQGDTELADVWFVYPHEAGGSVSILVGQSTERELTLPEGVHAAPFAILAWSFLRYPTDLVEAPAAATCTVDVQADERGVATQVDPQGCAEPFVEATREAVRRWRFSPPLVHGEPVKTALTFSTTFDPEAPAEVESWEPGSAEKDRWLARQFDSLTRRERLWFIREALTPEVERDLGPGHVQVSLPGQPEIGDAAPLSVVDEREAYVPPPLPEHPPVLVLERREGARVELYELEGPLTEGLRLEGPASCSVVTRVDSRRRLSAWAEACDDVVRLRSLQAARAWVANVDGPVASETFRVVFRYPARGPAELLVDADEVKTARGDLPPQVATFREPRAVRRVPPKLPQSLFERGLPSGDCRVRLTVTSRGKPSDMVVMTCPEGFERYALKALKRWRWEAAEEDGEPVPFPTEVTVRFAP